VGQWESAEVGLDRPKWERRRPAFVVLDECTNGISPDVEQDIYNRCTVRPWL
jgi:hypothetical protein